MVMIWITVFWGPPAEKVEVFDLGIRRSQPVIIGKVEVILKLESVSPKNAIITYSVDGEAATKEYEIGDVVIELPEGKIVLDNIEYDNRYGYSLAQFRVSGNFKFKEREFMLLPGENKRIFIGGVEVVLEYSKFISWERATITCWVDGEAATKEYEIGDVVIELPEGKIVWEDQIIIEWAPIAWFRVSGNFEM
jgi:uncharacterized protein (UPF0128 family)